MAADAGRGRLNPARAALVAAGVAWTAPNTLLGLLAGVAGIPLGARARLSRRERALVFQHWPWGPGGAITLGNVILHTGPDLDCPCSTYAHRAGHAREDAINLADHERALSPPFVLGREYGTRCSTVVLVEDSAITFVERRFGPEGVVLGESYERLPRP